MSLPVQATDVRVGGLIQRVGSLDDVKRTIALYELNITVFRGQIVEIFQNVVMREVLSLPAIEQRRAFELINDFILNITAEDSEEGHGLDFMEVFEALLSVYCDVPTRMNYYSVKEFFQQMPARDIEVAWALFQSAQSAVETAQSSCEVNSGNEATLFDEADQIPSFERTENEIRTWSGATSLFSSVPQQHFSDVIHEAQPVTDFPLNQQQSENGMVTEDEGFMILTAETVLDDGEDDLPSDVIDAFTLLDVSSQSTDVHHNMAEGDWCLCDDEQHIQLS